tara:strand:- start:15 stop:275 length:261 start_codon:yes stop_codon:yes gene_type:complete
MTQKFRQIKNPIVFSAMMDTISDILPKDVDEEDLIAIIFSFVSMYVHDADMAEYALTICADNIREFYEKLNINGNSQGILTVDRIQ